MEEKMTYETPAVTEYGSLTELTLGWWGGNCDSITGWNGGDGGFGRLDWVCGSSGS